jgi:hypothetical protein
MGSFKCFFAGVMIFLMYSPSVAQPEVGLFVGLNNSKLVGDGPSRGSFKYTRGFLGAVHIDFKLSENTSLSFQPGFRTGGAKIAFEDTVLQESRDSLKINLLSFNLPLLVKITSMNKRVYFAGGFSFDLSVGAKADNGEEKIDILNEIHKMNLNAQFALGYRIPIRSTTAFIELRYLQGLVNLSDQRNQDDAYLPRVKSSAMQLIFGWQFPIRKNK